MRFDRRAQGGDNLVDAGGRRGWKTLVHRAVASCTSSCTGTPRLARAADLHGRPLSPLCTPHMTDTSLKFSVRPFFETVGRAPRAGCRAPRAKGLGMEGGRA